MKKKIVMGIGALAVIATPIIAVSCTPKTKKINASLSNQVIQKDGMIEEIREYLEANTNIRDKSEIEQNKVYTKIESFIIEFTTWMHDNYDLIKLTRNNNETPSEDLRNREKFQSIEEKGSWLDNYLSNSLVHEVPKILDEILKKSFGYITSEKAREIFLKL